METQTLEAPVNIAGIEPLNLNPHQVLKLHLAQSGLESWISELEDLDGCEDLQLIHETINQVLAEMQHHYDELLTITD